MSIVRLRPARSARTRTASSTPPEEGQRRLLRLQRRLAVIGALLGLAIGALAFLPASLVAAAVSSATDDRFLLAEARGTVWDGSALPVLTGGAGSNDASVLPSRLEWRLRPRWNGLMLHLAQDCCLPHGVDLALRRRLGAWQLDIIGPSDAAEPAEVVHLPPRAAAAVVATREANAAAIASATPVGQWPLGWLEGVGFPWNTIHPGGLLTLTTHDLGFALKDGHWRSHGVAQLEIRQASSRLSTLDTLGSYRFMIEPDPSTEKTPGEGATRSLVWISTIDGPLMLDGRGLIGATGLRLRAQASAAPGSEAGLNNLLNIIGRRNGAQSVISIG